MDMIFDMKKYMVALVVGAAAISTSACSTSSTVRVSQAAPITYKVDQAALVKPSLPRSSSLPEARPTYAIPSPYTPQGAPAPRQVAEAPAPINTQPFGVPFDPSAVDRDLYKHQKVGKRYTIMGQSYTPRHNPDYDKVGEASWYGDKFHGKPTATGEIYNKNAMTAAHKTLPLNSMLHVTNVETGKSIMVRLNDRGPFIGDRIIDLSEAAARALGTIEKGVGMVRVRYVGPADPMAPEKVVEAPRPVPVPQSLPQAVPYTAPTPAPQTYQPLRRQDPAPELAQRPAPEALPQSSITPQEYAPYVPPVAIQPKTAQPLPKTQSTEPAPDEVITLTIKGPIHMAKSTMQKKAEWIPAVNYTTTPK